MLERSEWIKGCEKNLRGGTVYLKNFRCAAKAEKAILEITALGVYEAKLNGERVGDFILAPGWTSYSNRLQVQSYDVTNLLKTENSLEVTVGQGWRAIANKRDGSDFLGYRDTALIAELTLVYADGRTESIVTDSSWTARESKLRYTNIYDGDIYDATFKAGSARHCICVDLEKDMLIPQEGEKIVEQERMPALQIIKTLAGETVIDFGQNMTGYVEFRIKGTPDAQVFVRTASLNFDVERFFKKWLRDLAADQGRDGCVPHVIPNISDDRGGSSAWSDAAVICPWEIYRTYGDKAVLEEQFDSMKAWIDWMRERSENGKRSGGSHFGDWLGLDSPEGSYKGATPEDLIATAYYKYSTELFIKAAHALGRDVSEYENIPAEAAAAFRREYMENGRVKNATQTACVLALYFDITDDRAATAGQLNELIERAGHLETGFVGTPYLLHALSDNGYAETAYDLLLRREYPSWLYPISKGATTVWEHWDGIKPDGTMWSTDMNSFNHYAYGAVADWMYGAAAGINSDPDRPGFEHIIFRPVTDRRLDFVKASIDTRRGTVASEWRRENGRIKYIFTVPEGCCASTVIGGEKHEVGAGTHEFLE